MPSDPDPSVDGGESETGHGFIYSMDRDGSTRQFQLSLCVVAVLGMATLAAALGLRGTVAEHRDASFPWLLTKAEQAAKTQARS